MKSDDNKILLGYQLHQVVKCQTESFSSLMTRMEMFLETSICLLFNHHTWLVARENFIAVTVKASDYKADNN
jgi:hypothetical protein